MTTDNSIPEGLFVPDRRGDVSARFLRKLADQFDEKSAEGIQAYLAAVRLETHEAILWEARSLIRVVETDAYKRGYEAGADAAFKAQVAAKAEREGKRP